MSWFNLIFLYEFPEKLFIYEQLKPLYHLIGDQVPVPRFYLFIHQLCKLLKNFPRAVYTKEKAKKKEKFKEIHKSLVKG